MLLENHYHAIHRKLIPGPRRFTSMDQLDADLQLLRSEFEAAVGDTSIEPAQAQELLDSFLQRVQSKRQDLQFALSLRRPALPAVSARK
jgi:hypothetical protein